MFINSLQSIECIFMVITGSNPFGMVSSPPLYNPFAGNVIMTPGYSQPVAAGFGQYGLSQQTGMAVGYGQFSGVPMATRVQYGFANGAELTGGNTWAGKVSMPVGGLSQSGPGGWGQPSAGVNPFLVSVLWLCFCALLRTIVDNEIIVSN